MMIFNSFTESIAYEVEGQRPNGLKAEWAIDSEVIRARGIIVLVKSN